MTHSKSRAETIQAQVRDQGAALAEKVGPAVALVGPAVISARDWAQPKLEKGWASSLDAATPHVHAAVSRVTPAVDSAHEKLTEDLLPRLVDAVHEAGSTLQEAAAAAKVAAGPAIAAATTAATSAATTAATTAAATTKAAQASAKTAAAAGKATTRATAKSAKAAGIAGTAVAAKRSSDALAVLKGEAVAQRKKKKGGAGRTFLLVSLVLAGGAAAFAAVRNRRKEDPWAAPGAAWTPAAPSNKPTAVQTTVPASPASGTEAPTSGATAAEIPSSETAPAPGVDGEGDGVETIHLDTNVEGLADEGPSDAVKNFEEATAPLEGDEDGKH